MYSFQSRVRFSEVGQDNKLTIPSIVNYFQDCSTFQSEHLGVGMKWLKDRNRCWVISSWQIKVLRRPEIGENITIGTWATGLKGFFGNRCFCIRDEEGRDLALANTVWTYLDTESLRPTRVDEETSKAYPIEEDIPGEWKGRKIAIPEEGEEQERITVGRFLLDTNGHVNNEKYVLIAMEYVPKEFEVSALRVEYKRSAVYKDEMIPVVTKEDKKITVVLKSFTGDIFTVVEFERG